MKFHVDNCFIFFYLITILHRYNIIFVVVCKRSEATMNRHNQSYGATTRCLHPNAEFEVCPFQGLNVLVHAVLS